MPYLSHLLGQRVIDSVGQTIGNIVDLAITIEEPFGGEFPPVTLLLLRAGKTELRLRSEAIIDWTAIENGNAVLLDQPRARLTVGREKEGEIYLKRDVLDKQILDMSNARLVRVNDVFLIEDGETLRAAGVDVSLRGLLRRIRLETPVVKIVKKLGVSISRQHIPWNQVEVIRGDEGGRIISRVPTDKLSKMHPSDLANIVTQMTPTERAELIEKLDDETIALALEETDDEIAADIIETLDVERAADIIEEMDPDEAADVLSELDSRDNVDAILDRLDDQEDAADIKHLLSYEEGTAGALMNTDVVCLRDDLTCGQAIEKLREAEANPDMLYYLYIENEDEVLNGVISLGKIVLANEETLLKDLIEDEIISVHPDASADECARLVAKYNLLSLPVVDLNNSLLGIVTVDDVMDEIMPEEWTKTRRAASFEND
jgi:magnesium transporter